MDIVVGASIPSVRLTRVLEALAHGAPATIRVDNVLPARVKGTYETQLL